MAYDEYTIESGDTLSAIARRHGMSWRQLYNYDGGTGTPNRDRLRSGDPDLIHPGEVIVVPASGDRLTGTSGGDGNVCVIPSSGDEAAQIADLVVRVTEVTNGAPVEGATVQISGPSGHSDSTDPNGEVLFERISPGQYTVEASRNGFDPVNQPVQLQVTAAASNSAEVELSSQAEIEVVRDHDNDFAVDEHSPVADHVRFGIWDNAYDGSGNVQNQHDAANNFVGADTRRFYFRVTDPLADSQVDINWKTIDDSGANDDAPASQGLTLLETGNNSGVFVSKAVMLTSDDTDQDYETHSGFTPPMQDAGLRQRGQSNHRMRKASLGGFVKAEYTPASGGTTLSVRVPTFKPDELRRLPIRVINYGGNAGANYIDEQVVHANDRWRQVGLKVEVASNNNRPVPANAVDANGRYTGSANNPQEQAALADLIPITPDNTLTVVFVRMTGANAYATVAQRNPVPLPAGGTVTLGDRYFIFVDTNLNLNDETLAHELHHVLFNRFDTNTGRQFFVFNTSPPTSFGVGLPDVRIYRRIHNRHSPDPNNDPNNDNILNWVRRGRSNRHPIGGRMSAATNTTGNNLVQNY